MALIILSPLASAQSGKGSIRAFFDLSRAERAWVLTHPFVAPKALKVSRDANNRASLMKSDSLLDGDHRGGQVDAFRHGYWMASLSQEIHPRKARKLGYAHEKGNKRQYTKAVRKKLSGPLPDAPNCTMDLFNNDMGISLGLAHPQIPKDSLQTLVLRAILDGRFIILKKDQAGNFLDCEGFFIDMEEYRFLWENPKCLVPSNFQRPAQARISEDGQD